MKKSVFVVAAGLVAAYAGPAAAATIVVDTTDDDITDNGNCTLREAVEAATSDVPVDQCSAGSGADTIQLSAGTFVLTLGNAGEDGNQEGDLDVANEITFQGAGVGATVIDGNGNDRVLHIQSSGVASVLDVTIRNGLVAGSPAQGGAILNEGSLVLTRARVADSAAGGDSAAAGSDAEGGAIFNGGSLTMDRCTVSGNFALGGDASGLGGQNGGLARGGGIANGAGATLSILRSTISGNEASGGTSLSGTDGDAFGAGLSQSFVASDTIAISSSTISGNAASGGTGFGGGILGRSGVSIELSTIAANSADEGGGLFSTTTNDDEGPVIRGVILGDNSAAQGPQIRNNVQSQGFNLLANDGGGVLDQDGANVSTGDIVNVDPLLEALADNGGPTATHGLLADSIAIDAGTCQDLQGATVDTDQRGLQREVGDTCDIGSFERAPGKNSVVSVTAEAQGANCSHGGQRIDAGIDLDDDGILDANEIQSTSFVCNGEQSLVSASAEPAGQNCVAGGIRVDSGLDNGDGGGSAGNGTLEAGEIDSTSFVCDGVSVLAEVTAEAAGNNCAAGGQRIDTGLDNGDGGGTAGDLVLQSGEIDQTVFACNGVDAVSTLVAVSDEAAGANCPAGGQRVDVGADNGDDGGEAGNGILEFGEVDQSVFVCNGEEPGAPSLMVLTALEEGDANCPAGGSLVQVGLDNGDGGETANDGTLGAGEVDQESYACNGESNDTSLIDSTPLDEDDPMCPAGGVRVDVGLDNGDGDGTAGDGTLDPDEVDDTLFLCNGEKGASGGCSASGSKMPPLWAGFFLLALLVSRRRRSEEAGE